MIICSGGSTWRTAHEEIIYQSGSCPLCEAIAEIKSRDNEIEALNKEVEDGKGQ